MAIFKKLLVTETTAPRKISSSSSHSTHNNNNNNHHHQQHTFPALTSFGGGSRTHRQPAQQHQPAGESGFFSVSCGSSLNDQRPQQLNTNAADGQQEEQGVPDDLDGICWHIYKKALRRADVRLVVFSEKDSRLLYDSDTVVATADRIVPGSHRSQDGRFQFLPHKYDTIRIARMLFGTLPTSLKSDSLKIHALRDTNSIMISRVFSVPRLNKYSSPFKSSDLYKCMVGSLSSDSDNQSNYSTIRSLDAIRDEHTSAAAAGCPGKFPLIPSRTFANPDPPEKFTRVRNSSLQLDANDAEDIMEELRAFSPNRMCRARRRQLSQIGLDESFSIRLSNRSRLSSCSSILDGCGLSDSSNSADFKQFGFAIIVPNDFRHFIFQHILQVEHELDRLIVFIHKAVQDKPHFFESIYEGWESTCDSLSLLCNSLRLKNPVWLSLISTSEPSRREALIADFCTTFAHTIERLNTKETKFFLSTLLSAVLMNQLTWVASVAPPEKCPISRDPSMLLGMSVIDPKHISYNPTVAQLLELYYGIGGAVNANGSGAAAKFTKIVVVGSDCQLMAELLQVLSYFVRCSSVESQRKEFLDNIYTKLDEPLHDFGRTLIAGVCTLYSPHFVLSGINAPKCQLDSVLHAIYEDVRHPMGEPCTNSQLMITLSPSNSHSQGMLVPGSAEGKSAQMSPKSSSNLTRTGRTKKDSVGKSSPEKLPKQQVREEQQKNSLVVVIDMHNFVVRIITAENCQVEDVPFTCPSDAVGSMLEEFAELYGYKCAPDFLLSFLEDRLGSLLDKSNVLVNLLTTSEDSSEPMSMERVSGVLNCDCSDLRLILNIAAVYAPGILASAL